MYPILEWLDSVRDPARTYKLTQNADGTVTLVPAGKEIQKGTSQSSKNFNNIECGILEAHIVSQIMMQHYIQKEYDFEERITGLEHENRVEIATVTLNNSQKYPFNNSERTISLVKTRDTANYLVEVEIISCAGGLPGEVHVSAKALNGFKISFDGSAKSVTVKYIVKGGIRS